MAARYKVIAFLITFAPASMAFIGATSIFIYGYIANLVIFAAVILLLVENWRIIQLDNYLFLVDRSIQEIQKIQLDGWETHLRKLGAEGRKPTKWFLIGLIVFFVPVYTLFNAMASFLSDFSILGLCESQILFFSSILFILVEIPVSLFCIYHAYRGYKGWVKAVALNWSVFSERDISPSITKELLYTALIKSQKKLYLHEVSPYFFISSLSKASTLSLIFSTPLLTSSSLISSFLLLFNSKIKRKNSES